MIVLGCDLLRGCDLLNGLYTFTLFCAKLFHPLNGLSNLVIVQSFDLLSGVSNLLDS